MQSLKIKAKYQEDHDEDVYCPSNLSLSDKFRANIIMTLEKAKPSVKPFLKENRWWYEHGVEVWYEIFLDKLAPESEDDDIVAAWWLVKATLRESGPLIFSDEVVSKILSFLCYHEKCNNKDMQPWWDRMTTIFSRFEKGEIKVTL